MNGRRLDADMFSFRYAIFCVLNNNVLEVSYVKCPVLIEKSGLKGSRLICCRLVRT